MSANPQPASFGSSRRNAAAMLLGVLLYFGLSWITNIFPLATAAGVDIRPGVAVPIFFGFAFGPVVGFVTGTFGNFLGDLASGYVSFPPDHATGYLLLDGLRGFQVNWEIGNGLLGLIPGLAALAYRRYFSFTDQLRALVFVVLGIIVGMGFASFTDVLIDQGMTVQAAFSTEFLPAASVDLVNGCILVPILLFNYARLESRPSEWVKSGLMRRLCVAILVSAALPVALLGMFLTQQATGRNFSAAELEVRLMLTIAITLVLAVASAALIAVSLTRPLLRLTRAAQLMETGRYPQREAAELKDLASTDEVGTLSRLFGRMAVEVLQREENLRRQVAELKIEIDQVKKQHEVEQITGTEYFENLRQKAREIRMRPKPAPDVSLPTPR